MSDSPFVTLRSRVIWRSPWYNLRQDDIRLPDGSESVYTVVERQQAVFIVPVLTDGRLALIRNYRYTLGGWLWEVPAGSLQAGERPIEAARRELAEEIGGRTEHLELAASFYTMPGICNELSHVFLAYDVVLSVPQREPSEVMECHIFETETVAKMVMSGELNDGPSALALLLCLPRLGTSLSSYSDGSEMR
jgi:8-oxo-dGTP pyrophosphatase MutT (NUDIX family)